MNLNLNYSLLNRKFHFNLSRKFYVQALRRTRTNMLICRENIAIIKNVSAVECICELIREGRYA